MNRQGPGRISWTDWTWNPVTGCRHGCWYCAAARMAGRFRERFHNNEPWFYPERLREPLSRKVRPGARVFAVFQGDLLGAWVDPAWIEAVIDVVRQRPDVVFQFLTKNPGRYQEFTWPENAWLGTSAATAADAHRIQTLLEATPKTSTRWASIAPCLEIEPVQAGIQNLRALDWIVLEPLHHRTARNRAQSEENVRFWRAEWVAHFHRVQLFVKGMRAAYENAPQMYPRDPRFMARAAEATE